MMNLPNSKYFDAMETLCKGIFAHLSIDSDRLPMIFHDPQVGHCWIRVRFLTADKIPWAWKFEF